MLASIQLPTTIHLVKTFAVPTRLLHSTLFNRASCFTPQSPPEVHLSAGLAAVQPEDVAFHFPNLPLSYPVFPPPLLSAPASGACTWPRSRAGHSMLPVQDGHALPSDVAHLVGDALLFGRGCHHDIVHGSITKLEVLLDADVVLDLEEDDGEGKDERAAQAAPSGGEDGVVGILEPVQSPEACTTGALDRLEKA